MQVYKLIYYKRGANSMSRRIPRNQRRKKRQSKKRKSSSNSSVQNSKIIKMPQTETNYSNNNAVVDGGHDSFEKNKNKKGIIKDIIIGTISGLAVSLVVAFLTISYNQSIAPYTMKYDFIALQNDLSENLSSQFNELEDELKKDIGDQLSEIESRVNRIEEVLMSYRADNTIILEPVTDKIIYADSISVEMEYVLSAPIWNKDDIIFKNINNDTTYRADDLNNQKILVTYTTGNKENYFYGQYSESNQWDGDCIINVYENNILQLVMEAEYDNGVLLTYKQINKFTTKAGVNVWNISRRTCKDNYTCGENWYYFRGNSEYEKEFTSKDVTAEDIINISIFEAGLKNNGIWLEGYYYGNTKDAHFNDETGDAFMIKYFENGAIRTFYSGNFKNGNFEDTTGNAWYITRDVHTPYMYYKGNFEMGHPTRNPGSHFNYKITSPQIYFILNENNFDISKINPKIPLVWDDIEIEQDYSPALFLLICLIFSSTIFCMSWHNFLYVILPSPLHIIYSVKALI